MEILNQIWSAITKIGLDQLIASFVKLVTSRTPFWLTLIAIIGVLSYYEYYGKGIILKECPSPLYSYNFDANYLIEEKSNLDSIFGSIEREFSQNEEFLPWTNLDEKLKIAAKKYAAHFGLKIIGAGRDLELQKSTGGSVLGNSYEIRMFNPTTNNKWEFDFQISEDNKKIILEEVEVPISYEILLERCEYAAKQILQKCGGDPRNIMLIELSECNPTRVPGLIFIDKDVNYEYKGYSNGEKVNGMVSSIPK
jgi:hypothetical protein